MVLGCVLRVCVCVCMCVCVCVYSLQVVAAPGAIKRVKRERGDEREEEDCRSIGILRNMSMDFKEDDERPERECIFRDVLVDGSGYYGG